MMDESTESGIRLHGEEIRQIEKKHNVFVMELESLDYEEIIDYLKWLKDMDKEMSNIERLCNEA